MTTYSLDEVARILGVPPARVRALVDAGVCAPEGEGFTFQDLVKLRAAKALMDTDLPPRKLKQVVQTVARKAGGALQQVKVRGRGKNVVVQDDEGAWNANGQGLLFPDAGTPATVPTVAQTFSLVERRAQRTAQAEAEKRDEARGLFEQALAMEAEDPAGAVAAYQRALELDAGLTDAYVNLGRIAHHTGHVGHAIKLYEKALELAPEDPVAHYNFALALEDRKHFTAATSHYARAVELDPEFADAHYNLALLAERTGDKATALKHLMAYKRLVQGRR